MAASRSDASGVGGASESARVCASSVSAGGGVFASANAPAIPSCMASATASSTAASATSMSFATVIPGRVLGRGDVATAIINRMVLADPPASPSSSASSSSGRDADAINASSASDAGISGFATRAFDGAFAKPRSSSSAIFELRCAVDWPPKMVAMMRTLPRSADAVRLNPAGTV